MKISGYIQLDCNNVKQGKILPYYEKVNKKSSDSKFSTKYYDIDDNGYYSFDLNDDNLLGLDGKYYDEDNVYILAIVDSNLNECKKDTENAKYIVLNKNTIGDLENTNENNFIIYEKRSPILQIFFKEDIDNNSKVLNKKKYHFDLLTYLSEEYITDSCFNNNESEIYKINDSKVIFFDNYLLKNVTITFEDNTISYDFSKEDEILSFHKDIEFSFTNTGSQTLKIEVSNYQNATTIKEYNFNVEENKEPYLEIKIDKTPYINNIVNISSNNKEGYYDINTKIKKIDLYIDDKLYKSFETINFKTDFKVTERKTYKISQKVLYENEGEFGEAIYNYYMKVLNSKPIIKVDNKQDNIIAKKYRFIINVIDPDKIGITELKIQLFKDKLLYETAKQDFEYLFTEEGFYKLKIQAKDDIDYSQYEYDFEVKIDETGKVKLVNMEEITVYFEEDDLSIELDEDNLELKMTKFKL